VAARDALLLENELVSVWGVRARRDAASQAERIERDYPKMKQKFEGLCERHAESVKRDLRKVRRGREKLEGLPASRNEHIQTSRDKEIAGLKAQEEHLDQTLLLLDDMGDTFSYYGLTRSRVDRLAQLGIDKHNKTFRDSVDDYKSVVAAAYDARDCVADVVTLEKLKTEDAGWTRANDAALVRATASLKRASEKLEKMVAREVSSIEREVAKVELKMKGLDARLEKMQENSSTYDRTLEQKWELETEVTLCKATIEALKTLGNWKRWRDAASK
jgi:hypothetical protein